MLQGVMLRAACIPYAWLHLFQHTRPPTTHPLALDRSLQQLRSRGSLLDAGADVNIKNPMGRYNWRYLRPHSVAAMML